VRADWPHVAVRHVAELVLCVSPPGTRYDVVAAIADVGETPAPF
jgi:hypothetical protein